MQFKWLYKWSADGAFKMCVRILCCFACVCVCVCHVIVLDKVQRLWPFKTSQKCVKSSEKL